MPSDIDAIKPLQLAYDTLPLGYIGIGAILPLFVSVTVKDRDCKVAIGVIAIATLAILAKDLAELHDRARESTHDVSSSESEGIGVLPFCLLITWIIERGHRYFYPHLGKKKRVRKPKKLIKAEPS